MARDYRHSPEPPDPSYGDYGQPHYDDEDDFVVELPPAFEQNPGVAPPQQPYQQPYSQPGYQPDHEESHGHHPAPATGGQGGGISGVAAFFLGMLAQLILLGCIGIALYVMPEPTGKFFQAAQAHFQVEEDAPEVSEWDPSIEVDTDVVARMEILELEDRVIYGKERIAWDELVRQSQILNPADLTFDAVHASLKRIRLIYAIGGPGTPAPLDARVIFPGKTSESELPDTAIIQVLRDKRQPPEIRRRAAFLLADSTSPSATRALYDSIQDDPNLDVVKQAFTSFCGTTGYPGEDFLDTQSVASWWDTHKAGILGQN